MKKIRFCLLSLASLTLLATNSCKPPVEPAPEHTEHVDTNHDGKCDECGETMDVTHTDSDHDGKCDVCGTSVEVVHEDKNHDGHCDVCGAEVEIKHVDENHDNTCDVCGADLTPIPDYEAGDKKDVLGTGLMFTETLGYNTRNASVFEENNERYVIYEGNETKKGDQVIAARKATLVDGSWKYWEKHIVLKGSDSWDKYVSQPSVVKGIFNLDNIEYHYLMAYNANEEGDNYNFHIGLAVTNDILGEWVRVGNTPILENPEIYSGSFGYGNTSLVSVDKAGKLLLSYTFGETQLTGTRVKCVDASDLNNIKIEDGYSELPIAGLTNRSDNITNNASIALSEDLSKVYIANDGMPSSNAPGNATSFEVAWSANTILNSVHATWSSIKTVGGLDTMDENDPNSLGWDELYSATFVTNEYGLIKDDATSLEVVYSTFNEGVVDTLYTSQLCSIEVSLGA